MWKETYSRPLNYFKEHSEHEEGGPAKANLLLVYNGNDFLTRKWGFQLVNTGHYNFVSQKEPKGAMEYVASNRCDIVFVDLYCSGDKEEVFTFVERFRVKNQRGALVLLSRNPMAEDIYRAALLGASDFLICGQCLNIADEAVRILKHGAWNSSNTWRENALRRTGLFRTAGLTRQEMDILLEFSKDFPRHNELAERLCLTTGHVNKVFSRIYEKLSEAIAVSNLSQLTHLITACSLFR